MRRGPPAQLVLVLAFLLDIRRAISHHTPVRRIRISRHDPVTIVKSCKHQEASRDVFTFEGEDTETSTKMGQPMSSGDFVAVCHAHSSTPIDDAHMGPEAPSLRASSAVRAPVGAYEGPLQPPIGTSPRGLPSLPHSGATASP